MFIQRKLELCYRGNTYRSHVELRSRNRQVEMSLLCGVKTSCLARLETLENNPRVTVNCTPLTEKHYGSYLQFL